MNAPNLLTVMRIVLTVFFVFALYQNGLGAKALALFFFTLAVLTDFYDGYLARKYNLISAFGKIMDPIADKFLMLSAFFVFMQMHIIAVWMFIVICAREAAVTGLRLWAKKKGVTLAAEKAGKVKTILQIVAVYLIMIFIIAAQSSVHAQWYANLLSLGIKGIYVFMMGVVFVTIWSGLSFIGNNRKDIFGV
ncbi:MAG: CDP-diacylglycerol--glycerol-3-phosphate 3-phosphatidyltransferase [Candidatus Omnitrophica bacterium]|nr:CDP-diacylglycerol--glycerol-3-phosphate 3-phosphatidyltransferase [Candidatus Omnitrophota bacterium]